MNNVYYLKWPLMVLSAGILLGFIGPLMKRLHWQGSDIVTITATLITNLGLLFLIFKLYKLKNK